jgi:hypothetical protein
MENCCVSGSRPWQQISPEVIVRGFKKYCISGEMFRREDVEEREHEGESCECETEDETCEDTEGEVGGRNRE